MSKRPGDPGYAPGWCIHFRNAGRFDTCEVGVPYSTWRETQFAVRPCFLDEKGQSKPDALPCEHLRRPTTDEIAAHAHWLSARFGLLRRVMNGIRPWREAHKGQNFREVVECPECKGRLRLSIAAYNGHVQGCCETPGCASWME